MFNMFRNAVSFNQNLGGWYVALDNASIDRADIPDAVGTISAANPFLDGQNPTYRIEQGGDSDRFAIIDGNQLIMVSADADRETYTVTISATGDSIFGDSDNRWTIDSDFGGRSRRAAGAGPASVYHHLEDRRRQTRPSPSLWRVRA